MVMNFGHPGIKAINEALIMAGRRDHPEAISAILEAKADPNHRGGWGTTALHMTCFAGKRPQMVSILLRAKADPEQRNLAGRTALHFVALGTGQYAKEIA